MNWFMQKDCHDPCASWKKSCYDPCKKKEDPCKKKCWNPCDDVCSELKKTKGFTGRYAPSFWTQSTSGAGGLFNVFPPEWVMLEAAPSNGSVTNEVKLCIVPSTMCDVELSFNWSFISKSVGNNELEAGYIINGVETPLMLDNKAAGKGKVMVPAGKEFCLYQRSKGDDQSGVLSVTCFKAVDQKKKHVCSCCSCHKHW